MKKSVLLCAGVFALATVGTGFAALDPTNPGLPQAWDFSTNEGYGLLTGLNGNPASAMCVDCHSVNPSQRIPQANVPVTNAAIGFTGGLADNAHWGSHVVVNETAGLNSTNSGGGFAGGFGAAARDAGQYFNQTGAWSSAGTSKFGLSDGTTVTGSILQTDVAFDPATANMICESCHSIYDNVLSGTDNDLLLDTYIDNADDTICVVCHSDAGGDYAGFHGNDNLPAFAGTGTRKKHHVLTGDVLNATDYGAAGTDSVMWAPSASNKLALEWCTTKYQNIPDTALEWDFALGAVDATIQFRNACNVAGQGTRLESAVIGDIAPVDNLTMNCANCHRPHNAQSTGGAFLLRRGGTKDFAGKVGGAFTGQTAADVTYGIRRQVDVDTNYATKVYGEYLPLCEGCHQGYGL